MSDDQNATRRPPRYRHYVALLVGLPLLLAGMWGAGNAHFGINSRQPMPSDIKVIGVGGLFAAAVGGWLILRSNRP